MANAMSTPKVSVIIPTYNGKGHLGEAIQSVLDQTYSNFEIIIVDDASPEDVSWVVYSFTDPRVQYIRHTKNKGAVSARKTGVEASSGDIIAFLDQDDLFHKQKLEAHLDYFLKSPETGLTYNDRFEVQGDEKVLSGLYHPPAKLSLADWVLGFPISPSDVVLRREWAIRAEIWDDSFASQAEHVIFNGQEIVFGGRLALAGCKFGSVGRALNYRRYHPHRIQKYLAERCQSELACQEIIFSDPRCPEDVRAIKDLAHSNIYVMWAYTAYIQEEFDLGRKFLRRAMELHPEFFMEGDPCQFLNSWLFWVSAGTVDYVRNHEEILRSIFENLPMDLQFLLGKYDWAIAQSYLIKGLHTMVWGKKQDAGPYLKTAFEKNANADDTVLGMLTDELLSYEAELGSEAAKEIVDQLSALLSKLNRGAKPDFLIGFYALNRAFRNYQAGRFESVPRDIARAVQTDFKYLWNRGVLSILLRSLYSRVKV
jgi:glycosyltransferase involved in cell wall biosynthesis